MQISQLKRKYINLNMKFEALAVFTFVLLCFATAKELPSTFQTCRRNDEYFSNCLKSAIENALPQMTNGIKHLGVVSLDPIMVDTITILSEPGTFRVTQKYKNIKLFNLTTATVDKAEVTIQEKDFKLVLVLKIPRFKVEAEFAIDTNLFLFPVNQIGKGDLDIVNSTTAIVMYGKLFKKNGTTDYVRISNVGMDIDPKRIEFNFNDFVNGDSRLGEIANNFINDNWKNVQNEAKGPYQETVSIILKQIANAIFTKVPLEKIFPS